MHSQHENNMPLQRCSQNAESIGGTKIPIANKRKDLTGNDKSNIRKPDGKSNTGKLSSAAQALSLLHDSDISDSERLISSPRVFNEQPTQQKFTGRKNCVQTTTDGGLSTSKDNRFVYAGLGSSHSKQLSQDNLHLETKVAYSNSSHWGSDETREHYYRPQSEDLQKSSNIYGTVENSPFNIIGSWTVQNQSESMQTGRDAAPPIDMRGGSDNQVNMSDKEKRDQDTVMSNSKPDHAKSSGTGKQKGYSDNNRQWHFQASAGTLLQVRASHLVKLMCALLLTVAVFSLVFHSRIKTLEDEKKEMFDELKSVKLHLQLLVQRMEDVVSLAIPPRSQKRPFSEYEMEQQREDNMEQRNSNEQSIPSNADTKKEVMKRVVKRSASASRTTKELLYPSDSMGVNGLNNGTSGSYVGSTMDGWTVGGVDGRKTTKGNGKKEKNPRNKLIRRLIRKELRNLKDSHRSEIKGLKQTLELMQQQLLSANLSHCNATSQTYISSAKSAFLNSRAVYLQIDGSSVNIKKPRQLIGPWYLPSTGSDIGFNDMWYNHVSLDSNGTSIVFHENGLYLISAQVFYQLQHIHNAKPTPMGYRIHLKKNTRENHGFRRPLTIAECVPSFPSTIYQTCFTQVAWYVEAQDEVFLEHFTDSLPMIEALRSGQTFLGLVRLN